MPSFFYHVALDLYNPATSDSTRLYDSTSKEAYSKPANYIGAASEVKPLHSLDSVVQTEATDRLVPGPDGARAIHASLPAKDWRYDRIKTQNISMIPTVTGGSQLDSAQSTSRIANDIVAGHGGHATKGRFEPLNSDEKNLGWGIVRLFRDAEETPGLYDDTPQNKSKGSRGIPRTAKGEELGFREEDCDTLCILAVPSYLTPSDFLGFVGERTRDEVSHFRMIRTEKGNRYMVLMKFRSGKKARAWRKEWDGKPFDGMEPEYCHVVFIKSVEFRMPDVAGQESFPDMSNDPFTPAVTRTNSQPAMSATATPSTLSTATKSNKPMAPPTPSLIELPTCPVCLERMDESTGLLTILCQHVFHCTCLQKWRGSGCPVCRYTQDGLSKRTTIMGEEAGLNECSICRSDANLWICLICGSVGCGRYDAAHAFLHYQQTSHSYAMDLATQRVWDYATDAYVHRLVQDKADGKLMELPASTVDPHEAMRGTSAWDEEEYVPREKLDSIGQEYTHLLTSQLESQRTYFSEVLERAADKASQATRAADLANARVTELEERLRVLQNSHETLAKEAMPTLERDKDRASTRADRFEAMARKFEKEWREEKTVSGSLMERIRWLEGRMEGLKTEKADLEEQNRDLSFFISSGDKLKQLEGIDEEELREGSTTIAEPLSAGKGKKSSKKGRK
ncbi:MAG: hypothetical protein Q9219_002170 [cf. Caloplaca sp. 3 TL-2023]